MGIAVLDLAARKQPAHLGQFVDHGAVGVALFAIGLEDRFTAKEGQIRAVTTVFHHVVGDDLPQHAQIAVKLVFLQTVAGRTVHETCAFGVGDEIGSAEIAQIIPFAIAPIGTCQRVHQGDLGQGIRRHIGNAPVHRRLQPCAAQHVFGQGIGQQIPLANVGPTLLGPACDLIQAV